MAGVTNYIFIVVFSTFFNVYNASVCMVDGNSSGIFVVDPVHGKDSSFSGEKSHFFENKTSISFVSESSKFKKYYSLNSSEINQPVLDQRWESFPSSHDDLFYISNMLENVKTNIFFSIWNYENNSIAENQWHHVMVNNSGLYNCNDTQTCSKLSNNSTDFYEENGQTLWKIHDYTYFYTREETEEQIYRSNGTNCTIVNNGCVYIFVAMCTNCGINITISTNNNTYNRSTFSEHQFWKTEQFPLENFSNCFSIKLKTYTQIDDDGSQNNFWAVGDVAYVSSNVTCEKNKRYINLTELALEYNSTAMYCQNALNERINTFESFSLTSPTPPIKKSKSINPVYLLVIISILLVVIIVAALGYKFASKQKQRSNTPSVFYMDKSEKDHLLVETPEGQKYFTIDSGMSVKTNELTHYLHEICNPRQKTDYLQEQFSTIPSGYLKASTEGEKPENQDKNFGKIYPYDDNRVKLQEYLGDASDPSDYINASYVQGLNGPEEYIVTQNPLANTVTSFWRMIWQEKAEYVIMISSSDEKYHQYWPNLNKTSTFQKIKLSVTLEQMEPREYYNYRKFTLRRCGEMRIVHQLHFHAWLQEMLSPHVFLDFINHLLKIPHDSVPVLVHSKAGVGRSGTILLCDIALRTVNVSGSFNLTEITKQMRQYRAGMVENNKQYQLAHLIILEYLNYKDLSVEISVDYESQFSRALEGNTTKLIWSEYLEDKEWIYEAVTPTIICKKYPNRNRYTDKNLLPLEHSRVAVECQKPDYIHAMFVYDYNQAKNMIVAQQPLHSTLSDFWMMVLQNQVETIINLNELDRRNPVDCIFFPTLTKQTLMLENNMSVEYKNQENNYSYNKINVTLFSNGTKTRTLSIINVKHWPKIKAIPESTDIIINIWNIGKGTKAQNSRILICCDDGITASGLMACFYYMTHKMLEEHKCDVVGAVRAVRRTHTNFINFEQFVFLHHCALAFYRNCMKYDDYF